MKGGSAFRFGDEMWVVVHISTQKTKSRKQKEQRFETTTVAAQTFLI